MSNYRKKELQRAIVEIEKPKADDDLILTYADFKKTRDFLGYYEYNPKVLNNLVKLAIELWSSNERINRISLLEKIKQYYHKTQKQTKSGFYVKSTKPDFEVSTETKKLLFELFKSAFEYRNYYNEHQMKDARQLSNSLLINIDLTEVEEEWLCSQVTLSDLILNRVLRYPKASTTISKWALNSMNEGFARKRRSEHLSWVLDQDPSFEIDKKTLIDDFHYMNKLDEIIIEQYIQNVKEKKEEQTLRSRYFPDMSDDFIDLVIPNGLSYDMPKLQLTQRNDITSYYGTENEEYDIHIPNFSKMEEEFHENLATHQARTMIWAIGYSRLDNNQKFERIKKYYEDELHWHFVKIGKRTKNVALLNWLLENHTNV